MRNRPYGKRKYNNTDNVKIGIKRENSTKKWSPDERHKYTHENLTVMFSYSQRSFLIRKE